MLAAHTRGAGLSSPGSPVQCFTDATITLEVSKLQHVWTPPHCTAGLGDLITVQQRNIEELGFPEELHEQADALFLDLPRPWMVSMAPPAKSRAATA